MEGGDLIERGRQAFDGRAWEGAYSCLLEADGLSTLDPDDLERFAVTAYLAGSERHACELWERAFHASLERSDAARAARWAFYLSFFLLLAGGSGRSSGWLARGQRVLDAAKADCVESGYLLVPSALKSLFDGDAATALVSFQAALAIGERFGDRDLIALARMSCGQCLLRMGQSSAAVRLYDEVMVSVIADEVAPILAGIIYCAVLLDCRSIFDVDRAREWTAALDEWCASQPGLVPYRGQCLVHRSEILQLRGEWPDAVSAADRARHVLADPPQPALGDAHYQRAELHRLRGEFIEGEAAYREANRWGRDPQPGLSLLRLGQGRSDAAAASIRRSAEQAHNPVARLPLLASYVEIMLASGEVSSARSAADELSELALEIGASYLDALALHATSAVLLAEGDTRAALGMLRRACAAWRELGAPYEGARARLLCAKACRILRDHEAARLEIDAARVVFDQLGAAPDVARAERLEREARTGAPRGLTAREGEVLRIVASGQTNKAIAAQLVISEKTVERHVSGIFLKLGVSSRSAATAWFYEHARE
jgi:DNA-binding CsgD family transcriptional regulator